jgi:peptidylprolyl isomerase
LSILKTKNNFFINKLRKIYINKNKYKYMIENGKIVSVHYTGSTNGQEFDSSKERGPLRFEMGSGQLIAGFESALIGKNVGDKVTTTISPEEGYGLVREDLIVSVPLDRMPGEVAVGQALEAAGENGQSAQVFVKEVNEDNVVIDGNHPLAGKELVFEIEVLEIE